LISALAWLTLILAACTVLAALIVGREVARWLEHRRERRAHPHTVTCPCPICGTTIPLTVHHIPTLTVMVDRTDLAAHLLTHEETR
jgi:5-methylcytosine-specific restriction endonuclease McrA